MKVFEFKNYKDFLKSWLKEQPKSGRGQLKKIAEHLRVSTTLLSQVLKNEKHFSLESAVEICEFLCLNEKETEYFILLVEHQRAGSHKLKKVFEKKIISEQKTSSQLQNRIQKDRQLTDSEKMEFYSSWLYSAARLLTALPDIQNSKDLSNRLNVPLNLVNSIVNLCIIKDKKLTFGPFRTHIEKDSPFVVKHHQNWRIQGFRSMEMRRDEDLFYTQPMALSLEAAEKIRLMLPGIIEEIGIISGPSNSEVVRCLNIDWFEY